MNDLHTSPGFKISEVLHQGFDVLYKNFVPFVTLALILYSPVLIGLIVVADRARWSLWLTVVLVGSALCTMVLTASLTYGTFEELRGRHAGVGDCFRHGLACILPVIGVAFLEGLAIGGGVLLLIVPGLMIMTALWVAVPVAVVERTGAVVSLQRSAELTKGYRWSVFGIIVILWTMGNLADRLVAGLMGHDPQAGLLLSLFANAVLGALAATVTAVSYYKLRSIKDGTSIDELAAVFD